MKQLKHKTKNHEITECNENNELIEDASENDKHKIKITSYTIKKSIMKAIKIKTMIIITIIIILLIS